MRGTVAFRPRAALYADILRDFPQVVSGPPRPSAAQARGAPPRLDAAALVKEWDKQNDRCRGGSGDDDATHAACDTRDGLVEQLAAAGLLGLVNAVPDARRAYCAVSPANTGPAAGAQLFIARYLDGREAVVVRDPELAGNPPGPGERVWVLVDKIDQHYPDVPPLRLDISGPTPGDDSVEAALPPKWFDQMTQSGKPITKNEFQVGAVKREHCKRRGPLYSGRS